MRASIASSSSAGMGGSGDGSARLYQRRSRVSRGERERSRALRFRIRISWNAGTEMSSLHSIVSAGGTSVLLVCASAAQLSGRFVLDPKTYCSPSGEYALLVDPTRPDGGGAGRYRFTHQGTELWSGTRPWTLHETEVTDDGLVAGYAYGAGYEGGDGDALIIVLLDATGKVRLEERSKREGFHSDMGAPEPMVNGLFVDRAND